jgi:hypothetical protein
MLQTQDLRHIQCQQTRQTKLDPVPDSQVTKRILERPVPFPSDENDFCSSDQNAVASLLSRDVRAFLGGGRFHQENQKGEYNGNYRENQERVEIGKSRGLLFAKILQRL